MPRADEFTPLLVSDSDGDNTVAFRPRLRRSVWQLVLAGALSLGVLSLFQQKETVDVTVSFDADTSDAEFLKSMETFRDPAEDPCVDFYQYACGGWLQQHEIPSDRPAIDSSFYVVSESNKDTIRRILSQNPPQIGPFYQSCLVGQEVDTDAVAFVAQLIENVHQANSTLALMTVAGEVDQALGISSFFSWGVGADPQDPSNNVLQLAQGGLTLPSREYYLQEDKDKDATLFVDYVIKLFAVGDLDRHNVSEYAQAVLETETKFAEMALPNAALRDPWTTSTAFPFAEIAHKYPFLMAYLNGMYKQEPFPMLEAIVATPTFFDAQNELLRDESLLPQLKNYVSFHLIDSFGAVLGEYFRRASHEFHGKTQGAGALLPRDQFCVRLTTTFLGDELGEYYMKSVFGPDARAAAQALVAEIEESLKALLMTESWLDKVTYEAAVAKLDKVKNFIGGPDAVEPLPFELQADAFFNNVRSLMELSAAATIEAIDKPVDKQAWDMFPSTVNAYYDPSANKMVFPAAILQPPFYSAENFPAAANFARIGMVMGHEISHGFDDQGRNFDGDGALRSWWTPSVSAEFAEKAQCLAAQYSTFPVVSMGDDHVLGTVNGNLTLGENIADNGGIHLAYEAYQLWKSAFAPPPIVPPEGPTETPSPPAKVPHEKREEEDDDRHSRREHEERHRRDEAEGGEKDGHGDKYDDHDEEYGRHDKHGHRQEEEERHDQHEDKEERHEERKERHEEHREREKEHEAKRRRRDHEDREDGWDECGGCEREGHRRHNRHKHDEDRDEESERHGCGKEEDGCGSKRHRYAKIHSMVERLARAIAQPSDRIADDRLFFTAFAQNWCEKRTPAYAELLRTIDPHSPGKWRVNGPLMNYNKFAEAFSCPLGTPMNPEKKCVIW